jgi:hypothetical protein
MQLVLSNNRVIAHGENFLSMGGTVINTATGDKYENATVAECENCPSDINEVGYEYHAGVFVPCAPYGKGNNNGYFMEVCSTCATPRSSGIPIEGGLKPENLHEETKNCFLHLLWENSKPTDEYKAQTITLSSADYDYLVIECLASKSDVTLTSTTTVFNGKKAFALNPTTGYQTVRYFTANGATVTVSDSTSNNTNLIPYRIYGAKCV